ncbi:hypothetical protein GEV43_33905 [Actinomadura sp. J1-007]|uniref:FG-GAP and VCBS repeat-containing protein n=1 Tax=Actinomadura sp. J1-007 TaxID=2661913 RepID=UPI0013235DDC|nr:hypothetical protein [Actinomadura sp. J1-007]
MDLVVTGEGTSWVFRDITTKPVKAAKIPVTGRTGDRVRRRSVGPAAHAWARDPVVADVNGDHRSDLVLVVETPAADGEEGESFWNAELRLGTAKGLSGNAVGFGDDQFSDGSDPLAGDVNGDGRADVIVGAPTARSSPSPAQRRASRPETGSGFRCGARSGRWRPATPTETATRTWRSAAGT